MMTALTLQVVLVDQTIPLALTGTVLERII